MRTVSTDPRKKAAPLHFPLIERTNIASNELTCRKFGKHLQKRQLDIPEYATSFVNYKALKKVLISFDGAQE